MSKSSEWDFNCPQYFDFGSVPNDDDVEDYFAHDHESKGNTTSSTLAESPHQKAFEGTSNNFTPFQFEAPTEKLSSNRRLSDTAINRKQKNRYSLRPRNPIIAIKEKPIEKQVSPKRKKLEVESHSPMLVRRAPLRKSNSFTVQTMKPQAKSVERRKRKSSEDVKLKRTGSFNSDTIPRKVTKVEPFNFTKERRTKEPPKPTDLYQSIDFKATLRSNAQAAAMKIPEKRTKVMPFRLGESRKRQHEEAPKTFVSMAEQIKRFEQTPDRFRSHVSQSESTISVGNSKQKCTMPVTPKLRTLKRCRPNNAISQLQKEEQEAEDVKKLILFSIIIGSFHTKSTKKNCRFKMTILELNDTFRDHSP